MSETEDQLDSGGGITHFFLPPSNKKDDLGGFAIRDCLKQRLCALHKSIL